MKNKAETYPVGIWDLPPGDSCPDSCADCTSTDCEFEQERSTKNEEL